MTADPGRHRAIERVDAELDAAQEVAARDTFGLAIGGSLGQDKPQMYEVVGWTTEELPETRPRHLLGIGDVDDLLRGVELGVDTFDCAMPTRIGRHGMALVPDPDGRWRVDLAKGRFRESDEPICEGCPCAACATGYSRAYLHHLFRIGETTAARVLTLHNLAFLRMLMTALRDAIDAGRLAGATAAVRGGLHHRHGVVSEQRAAQGADPRGRPADRAVDPGPDRGERALR